MWSILRAEVPALDAGVARPGEECVLGEGEALHPVVVWGLQVQAGHAPCAHSPPAHLKYLYKQ